MCVHVSCHAFAVYGWRVTTFPQVIVDFAHTAGAWLSVFAIDKTEGLKQELDEMLRLQAILVSEITEKSLVKEKTLRDYITRKAEWYIPAKEAIALKLADEY